MFSHDEYKEMTVAHALDALETAEARELEEHLRTCAECRGEYDTWKENASSLAFAADPAEPSAELRSRVLQQTRTDSRISLADKAHESLSNIDVERSSNVIPLRAASPLVWSSSQKYFAIAASLIIVSLLVVLSVLWQKNRAMESELARLSRQSKESQQELARLREEKGLLTAPEARVASLTGTEMAKDAHAMLAYNHANGHAMLVANGLPPAPAGMAYQLWFIEKGKPPMPGGVFAADAAGHAEMRDVIPPEGRGATQYAVTLERASGVSAPEGKAYLQSSAS